MANRKLFKSSRKAPVVAYTDTLNDAGAAAYKFEDAHTLCQYVVTGTFGGTYYTSAQDQLNTIKKVVDKVHPELIAKAAVYGRQRGNMKDMPAYLLAVLASKGELDYLRKAWPLVVNNPKMMYNFVQIVRSGVTGRKSFGTAVRKLIRQWFDERTGDQIYRASVGASNPSMADVIKMVHPTPDSKEKSALFAYLLGAKLDERDVLTRTNKDGEVVQTYELTDCPQLVQDVEWFKYDNSNPVPALDYRALTNYNLTAAHWKHIAESMPWNALRMNLNVLQRNGVLNDDALARKLARKLADPDEVRKWNAFPYQLLTSFQNVKDVPTCIKNALQKAMEVATENVPTLDGGVAVCIDLSGSMGSPVTGYRSGASSVTTCYDAAALIAASIARTNKEAKVIAWASYVKEVTFNPFDSVMSNSRLFMHQGVGGGTNASLAMNLLNQQRWTGKNIIYVSDNQSWSDETSPHTIDNIYHWESGGTGLATEWAKYQKRVPNAKLVCIDVVPNNNTQVQDRPNVLNVGGFSDVVFDVVGNFCNNDNEHFVDIVEKVDLGD